MLKNIGSAIAGYIVMFIVAFVLFTGVWFVLGPDGAFTPGQWETSTTWLIVGSVLGFATAFAGGYACSALSENRMGPAVLVVLVLIVGVLQAIPDGTTIVGRPDNISMFDAMSNMRYPMWALILNPILGSVGVFFGARTEENA